jgi:ribosomal protein S18 acetylase RimI-like enzyme
VRATATTNLEVRPFRVTDQPTVICLWLKCGLVVPWNDPTTDIARKLGVQPQFFLVGDLDGEVIATAMAGYEGHRGWVNYLAVEPHYQRRGIGRRMMAEVERLLLAEGCPKINLQVRATNRQAISFYERIGFNVEPVIGLGKRLISP